MNTRSARLARVRTDVRHAGLDALLITHPPNIRYLTGLNASAAAAVVTETSCVLVVDFRYVTAAQALAAETESLTVRTAPETLDAAVAETLRSEGTPNVGVEAAYLPIGRFNKLSTSLGDGFELTATERIVERLRAIKDGDELAVMRKAGRLISDVAREARRFVVAGRTELQVAADVDAAVRSAGFERPAFDTIVASGPNGALPHARPTGRILCRGEGVVLDFGGIYDGYCVDLTRTIHLGPMPEGFRRLFDAVAEAQSAAIGAVRPGVAALDVDAAARRVLERYGLGEAFGHGTGHGLGLEIHEEPRLSPLTPAEEQLQAGMVFTIEPGAYVPQLGGVRIEDDVAVTVGGCERLTDVPIEL